MPPSSLALFRLAALGFVVWCAFLLSAPVWPSGDDPVSQALSLAALVIVPLGIGLIPPLEGEAPYRRALMLLLPLGQLGALVSLATDVRVLGGAAASCWVMVTLLVALMGLGRARSSAERPHALAVSAAWASLPVGAVWLVMARLGAAPLGLSSIAVSLTAVHFHYAAFATLTLFALAWRQAAAPWARRALVVALGLAAAAIVLVVLRIAVTPVDGSAETLGPWISRLGAALSTVAFALHAAAVVLEVGPSLRALPRALISLAALAPLGALVLAVMFTFGAMDLDTMVGAHGHLLAYGFAALGLLGWTVQRIAPAQRD